MRIVQGIFLLIIIGFMSCELAEEKISTSSSINLLFSTDTVIFDTLLTEKTSLTKRFRIFNPSKNAVSISSIKLGMGDKSNYSIIVNGKAADEVQEEILFGGDSMLVLVDVTIDPQDENTPYLVKDSVIVEWNDRSAHVKLVAWGQDANYIREGVICDEVWTADRPYVIYNYAIVDSLCTLTMLPGTRVFVENGSSLYVKGTLKIFGDSANRVTIRNTRFDENYKEAPGQWEAIYFLEGSKDNEVHFADIENGIIGLDVITFDDDTEFDLIVSHTIIRHMLTGGVLAFNSDVHIYNTLIHDCGILLGCLAGGNYHVEHCTFSNWPSLLQSENPGVVFQDFYELQSKELLLGDLKAKLENNIIWGTQDEEFIIQSKGQRNVSVEAKANIIRSKQVLPQNTTSVRDNFPGFKSPFQGDFSLDSLANARDAGIPSMVLDDLLGKPRDSKPDLGAYERIDSN